MEKKKNPLVDSCKSLMHLELSKAKLMPLFSKRGKKLISGSQYIEVYCMLSTLCTLPFHPPKTPVKQVTILILQPRKLRLRGGNDLPKGTQVEPGFKPESDPKALFFLAHSFVLTKKVADDLYNIEHIFACGWCWEEVLLSYQHGLTKNQVMHFVWFCLDQ